jgi:hypothetical protein
MKKLLPIFLILSILALVYGAKMYQYQDNPALDSEIQGIYHKLSEYEEGIKVKIGSFTCPGSTGNYSVTGVGFKPRCVEFMAGYASENLAYFSRGWMDYNGNQGALTTAIQATTHLSAGGHTQSYCIKHIQVETSNLILATYVSMDSDGFTINFTNVTTAFTLMWKAER